MGSPDEKEEKLRHLALKIINKEKWWDILSRFIDVLRINIFIVDRKGVIILPPEETKYGGHLLTDRAMGFWGAAQEGQRDLIQKFRQHGVYLEYVSPLHLNQFAIPVDLNGAGTIGYMVVGPVILNKRLENREYESIAQSLGIPAQTLLDEINGLRTVSYVMMTSILDLLYEIVKNNIELSGIKKIVHKKEAPETLQEDLPKELKDAAQELYSTVCVDELLVTLLDVALKMTNAECGSIMVTDQERGGDLVIKVARGLDPQQVQNARVRIGEGVAGIAAQERTPFIIHGTEGQNRIAPFLKRPEIKHALVMPLISKRKIFGVLNLHSKQDECAIESNFENLQYLTKLLSAVI